MFKKIIMYLMVTVVFVSTILSGPFTKNLTVMATTTTNGNGGTTDVGIWFNTIVNTSDTPYNTWSGIGENFLPLTLGSYQQYDAANTAVIDEQISNIAAAKIDFILLDLTNGGLGGCLPGNVWTADKARSICARLAVWNANHTWKVKYAIAIGTYFSTSDSTVPQDIESQAQDVNNNFVFNSAYGGPSNYYQVNGKALLVDFDGAHDAMTLWSNYAGDKTYGNNFTLRSANNGAVGQYGWFLSNGTQLNSEVEVVQPGWNNHVGGYTPIPRSQGDYYINCWNTVLNNPLPRIVMISSFNDWGEDTAVWTSDTSTITYPNGRIPEQWTSHDGNVRPDMYWNYTVAYISTLRYGTTRPTPVTSVLNSSFETPSTTTYQYAPTGSSWIFSSTKSGIQHNGSAFGAPIATDGVQTAFIQTTGSFSQSNINFPATANYVIKFKASARAGVTGGMFDVYIDSTKVGTFTPSSTSSFVAYSTNNLQLSAGNHSINFVGTGTGDCFIEGISISSSPIVQNLGFESPSISTYQYAPIGSGWTFSATLSGIQHNGGGFGSPTAPQGTQTAFIQRTGNLYQTINLPITTFYKINFKAAARAGYTGGMFDVYVDTIKVGSCTPSSTSSFTSYSLGDFEIASGNHTIKFVGTGTGDCFIDDVTITNS